ncbi:hypothetical protein HanHA89_Chr14g0542491 [Helianthus annuus]|nr:hypothetical protein HanHA89_Chr14g0542491 [Helianthus annuus]
MKGVGREDNDMWCDGCENPVVFPRGRLELEVFDSTAEAAVVCFDNTAQRLTKTIAHSILTAESGLSRVYSLYSTDIQDKFTPVTVRNADGSISTLPNCLHSLVGSTQTLQLDWCTYYDHGHFESFNYNVTPRFPRVTGGPGVGFSDVVGIVIDNQHNIIMHIGSRIDTFQL